MYMQARASLKPAPRTQSNQDAPLQPQSQSQSQPSSSPSSLDSPIGLIPSKNASRPNSINGQPPRDSNASPLQPTLISPNRTNTFPTSASTSTSRAHSPASKSASTLRWVVLGLNSASTEFVRALASNPNPSSRSSRHQLAAIIDSDSKLASQLVDSIPQSQSSPETGASRGEAGNAKVELFESLENLFSSSLSPPPTHLFISSSNSNSNSNLNSNTSKRATSNSDSDSNSNSSNQSTFQIASSALRAGLGVLIDKSAIFDPDATIPNGGGQLTHSEATALVSLASQSNRHSPNGETNPENGSPNRNSGSTFLGFLFHQVEKEELPSLLNSIAQAYQSEESESHFSGLSWKLSLGVIKTFDDLRSRLRNAPAEKANSPQKSPGRSKNPPSPSIRPPSSPSRPPSSPSRPPPSPSKRSPSTMLKHSPKGSPRSMSQPFPSTASPRLNSGLGLLTEEVNGTVNGDPILTEKKVDSQAALEAQVQELQQLLRHKNALISSLEQRASTASTSSVASTSSRRSSITAAQGHSSSPVLPRRRTSSLEPGNIREKSPGPESPRTPGQVTSKNPAASNAKKPTSRPSSPSTSSNGGGRNKSGEMTRPLSPLGPPISSINQLDAVREGGQLSLGEGFLAPTIASENRRMANLGVNVNVNGSSSSSSSGLNTTSLSSSNPNSSGKVINNLTQSLSAVKEALDATKAQLRASQKNEKSLQKSWEDARAALARARLENESSAGMMARKDRQTSEAVERARKAEAESKELGRASREWGTRVREVEEELGELRRKNARTEREYEVVASCWKNERGKMMEEVRRIKEEVKKVRSEEIQEIKALKNGLLEAQRKWRGLDVEKEKEGLGNLLEELQAQREKAVQVLGSEIQPLLNRMDENDEITREQEKVVREVEGELRRIKTLMRRAENAGVGN